MKVDIFYRSYCQDFKWLELSLLSAKKFAKGFGKTYIAIPACDIDLVPRCDGEVHLVEKWNDDYLGQQSDKLYADKFCHSDYILHIDSDCIWTMDVSPMSFFIDGKPVILSEDGVESPWPPIVARTIGQLPKSDYMRRMPIIYPRDLYGQFREWVRGRHGMELKEWIKGQPYREFTEYNCFGFWCDLYARDRFTWLRPSEFPTFCKQYWSWGGLTDEIRSEIERILAD